VNNERSLPAECGRAWDGSGAGREGKPVLVTYILISRGNVEHLGSDIDGG